MRGSDAIRRERLEAVAEPTAEQRSRLDEATAGLSDVQRGLVEAMVRLRNLEHEWQAQRLALVAAASKLVDAGTLTVPEVCQALGISQPTWSRRRAELREHLAGGHSVSAEAAGDQAAAATREAIRQVSKWQEGQA